MTDLAVQGSLAVPEVITKPPGGLRGRPWYAGPAMEQTVTVLAPIEAASNAASPNALSRNCIANAPLNSSTLGGS